MGSKDEDVVKHFGKNIVFPYAQLDFKFMFYATVVNLL